MKIWKTVPVSEQLCCVCVRLCGQIKAARLMCLLWTVSIACILPNTLKLLAHVDRWNIFLCTCRLCYVYVVHNTSWAAHLHVSYDFLFKYLYPVISEGYNHLRVQYSKVQYSVCVWLCLQKRDSIRSLGLHWTNGWPYGDITDLNLISGMNICHLLITC